MTLHSVVINMGPHKTGSTAIAQYLSEATRQRALDASLLYPTDTLWLNSTRSTVKHNELRRGLFPAKGDDEELPSREKLESTFVELRKEADRRGLAKVTTVLVSESLNDRGEPQVLEEFLGRYFDEITLVVFCRKQDSAVSSMISQGIKNWSVAAKSTAIDDYLTDGLYFPGDFDYLRSLEKWSAMSPKSKIVYVPYLEGEEGTLTILERFFEATSLAPMPSSASVRTNKANRALSKECLDIMCEIKAQRDLLAPRDPRLNRLKNKFWDVLRRFEFMAVAEGRGSSSFDNPWVLDSADRQKIQVAFQQSNTAFLRTVDRTPFAADWNAWEESVQPLVLADESTGDAGPTQLFIDVTNLTETAYPSMRSALSVAETHGLRSLTQCHYVIFDESIGQYRIVSTQKSLVFRPERGGLAKVRIGLRKLFNISRRRLWRLRFVLPQSGLQALRSIYENALSEARVTTIKKSARSWPVWVPAAGNALAILASPTSEKHRLAQDAAKSLTTGAPLFSQTADPTNTGGASGE